MTLLQTVSVALARWPAAQLLGNHVLVPTHCMYSSGSIVRVVVEGGRGEFKVHDAGGAIDEFSTVGAVNPKAISILRSHFRDRGIQTDKSGRLVSPAVQTDGLGPAIALIANASREAEDLLFSRWKPKVRRNFRQLLQQMLEAQFAHLKAEPEIEGASHKQHRFDFGIERGKGGLVLVDAVYNDPNAISSTVLRNLDVSRTEPGRFDQRIVYDDAEEWRAEDLNLLAIGAPLIPFSEAQSVISRLAA